MRNIDGKFSLSLCPVLAKTVSETKIKANHSENFGASMRIVSQQTQTNKLPGGGRWGDEGVQMANFGLT